MDAAAACSRSSCAGWRARRLRRPGPQGGDGRLMTRRSYVKRRHLFEAERPARRRLDASVCWERSPPSAGPGSSVAPARASCSSTARRSCDRAGAGAVPACAELLARDSFCSGRGTSVRPHAGGRSPGWTVLRCSTCGGAHRFAAPKPAAGAVPCLRCGEISEPGLLCVSSGAEGCAVVCDSFASYAFRAHGFLRALARLDVPWLIPATVQIESSLERVSWKKIESSPERVASPEDAASFGR